MKMADKSELTMLQEFVDAVPNTQTGALVQWAVNRIAELEAKLDVFDEMDEMLRICLNANVDMAEKLDRVRGLPEKWRDISYKTTDAYTNLHGCADELQSALGDEDE
jgi:hypothetical protein